MSIQLTTLGSGSYRAVVDYAATVVQVKDGYLGQIVVGNEVVWESNPFDDLEDAFTEAREHLHDRLKVLFT